MVNSEPIAASLISTEKSNRNGRTVEIFDNHHHNGNGNSIEPANHHAIPGDHRRRPGNHHNDVPVLPEDHTHAREAVKATLATIAAAAAHAHEHDPHTEPEIQVN